MNHSPIIPTMIIIAHLVLLLLAKGTSGATFTVINKCGSTIWPGILSNAGSNTLDSTGFELSPATSRLFQIPPNWSGRLWARTGCQTDSQTGRFACATGDCGSGRPECAGAGAKPPATLAEFTVAAGGIDFYDVSLVDGFNLPVSVDALGGSGGACLSTGCAADLNRACPAELRAGNGEACMSACEAFAKPEYCCSGGFGSPATCKASVYSQMFKTACPKSYSYAYDDPTSTFTCSGADYTLTFCPASSASQKSATDTSPPGSSSSNNGSAVIGEATTGAEAGIPLAGTQNPGTGAGFPLADKSNDPWFPDFMTGRSTKLISYFYLQVLTLLLVSISLICS